MDIDKLVHYLGQNTLNDSEAHYLSEKVLDLQDDLENALNDVSRLEIEHKLSQEEADRLFNENEKVKNEIEAPKTRLHLFQKDICVQSVEIEELQQKAINFANKRYGCT